MVGILIAYSFIMTKISLLFVILSFAFLSFSTQAANECSALFSIEEFRSEFKSLQRNLRRNNVREANPTVRFVELQQSDGRVLLKKNKNAEWDSSYDHLGASTQQSDPRNPIFLFGKRLAFKMGFRIKIAEDGTIYMLVPGAKRLEKWIRQMNIILKRKGYEPISYMPEQAGFVSPKEFFELYVKADPERDILLYFPYADNNPKLTPHEIAFHLGAILYPRKFMKRGHDINMLTKEFVEFLKSRRSELGSATDLVVEKILLTRGFDNDAGMANLTSSFAALRGANNFVPFSAILPALLETTRDKSQPKDSSLSAIEFYSRPYVSPLAAVMLNICLTTGVRISRDEILPTVKTGSTFNGNSAIYKKINLTQEDFTKLQKIAEDFVDLHKAEAPQANHEISTPEIWLQEITLGFDQRVKELLEAANEIPNDP